MFGELEFFEKEIHALPADVKRRRLALTPEAERLNRAVDRQFDRWILSGGPEFEKANKEFMDFFEEHDEEFPEGYLLYGLNRIHRKYPLSRPRKAALDWPTILVTSTLTPFLAAMANHYGGKAASTVGARSRRAVRRLIRRELHAGIRSDEVQPGRRPGIPRRMLQLIDENGIPVLLDSYIPAEGVMQLLNLDFVALVAEYDAPPYVLWSEDACEWRAQGTKNNAAHYSVWNNENRTWRHGASIGEDSAA
ncbi:hypothetical protein [Streptomyces reniochalinae]|uniref:hypothetical protein n=1 Tax=Streptomyces reniochalinae TaxID=2250578 RepID=UPI0011C02DD5|nr:hypothetical protein [Streptomyces reniochalinae]